jgi:hypothetical protein
MKFFFHRVLDTVDKSIPYLSIFLFYLLSVGPGIGFFPSAYQDMRRIFVRELKEGAIRDWLSKDWLKDIIWDQVVFNNPIIPDWAPGMFVNLKKNPYVQRQIEVLMQGLDTKDLNEKCYDAVRKNKKRFNFFFWKKVRELNLEFEVKNRLLTSNTLKNVISKNQKKKGHADVVEISKSLQN